MNELERLQTFTEHDLPTLDEVVLGALKFLNESPIPHLDTTAHTRPLIIGSVNALSTGRILFRERTRMYFPASRVSTRSTSFRHQGVSMRSLLLVSLA